MYIQIYIFRNYSSILYFSFFKLFFHLVLFIFQIILPSCTFHFYQILKLTCLYIHSFLFFFQISASSGQTNGLSSSLVFTPVQGLELVNPNAAAERVKAANNKWFNANSGFMSAAPSVINSNKLLG